MKNIFNSKKDAAAPPVKIETIHVAPPDRIDQRYNERFPTPDPEQSEAGKLELSAKVKAPEPPKDIFLLPPYHRAHAPSFEMGKLSAYARKAAGVKTLLEKSETE